MHSDLLLRDILQMSEVLNVMLLTMYKVMILPSSGAGAGRSEGGESAGELREGSGVDRTQPRPKRDAQLLQEEDVKRAILIKIS